MGQSEELGCQGEGTDGQERRAAAEALWEEVAADQESSMEAAYVIRCCARCASSSIHSAVASPVPSKCAPPPPPPPPPPLPLPLFAISC